MTDGLPIILAAEGLPPDLPQPGVPRPGVGPDGQFVPILGAALLVVVPVALLLFSRRQKRKRKIHLPRNPTLAETGGLPPRRSGE